MKRIVWIAVFAGTLIGGLYGLGDDTSCKACHTGAARDFALSSKSDYLTCLDCHGDGHNGPNTGEISEVTPNTCAGCHQEAVSGFNTGKHYYGWEAMGAVPTFASMPGVVTDKGCVVCHKVGYIWEDGSRGRCDSCHSRHLFSAAEARRPEACGTCHAGDHPHYAMWQNSKHGMLYAMDPESGRAPGCISCHGSHYVMTAWGFLGLREGDDIDDKWAEARGKVMGALEIMGPAAAPEVMRTSYAEWEAVREEMIARCSVCHAESYARRELEKGDDLLREADIAKANIIDIADKQFNEGIIDDKTRFSIYREATAHRFSTYMGGFHNSANYAWDEGYLGLVTGTIGERDSLMVEMKLHMIRGKMGQVLPLSIAGLAVAVVSVFGVLFLLIRNRRTARKTPAGSAEETR
jgi:hydroxylamine dehydrogenase